MDMCSDTEFHSLDVAMDRTENNLVRLYDAGSIVAEVRGFPFHGTDWYVAYQLTHMGDNRYQMSNERICSRAQLVDWLVERGLSKSKAGAESLLRKQVWLANLVPTSLVKDSEAED